MQKNPLDVCIQFNTNKYIMEIIDSISFEEKRNTIIVLVLNFSVNTAAGTAPLRIAKRIFIQSYDRQTVVFSKPWCIHIIMILRISMILRK